MTMVRSSGNLKYSTGLAALPSAVMNGLRDPRAEGLQQIGAAADTTLSSARFLMASK